MLAAGFPAAFFISGGQQKTPEPVLPLHLQFNK